MKGLCLKAISKSFGSEYAVKELSLSVARGEFLVIVGASGSGKTTTLRLIAGLETPDTGEVIFDGVSWNDVSPRKRNVAFVFQNYALYPHRTVRENIEYNMKLRGLPQDVRRRKAELVTAALDITHLLDRYPNSLSAGEAQRTALARGIVRDPSCFLLDEPLSNLDALRRVQARIELKRIQQELDTPTIYVTHDQEEAAAIGDRIGVIHEGQLRQVDQLERLLEEPCDTDVAQFFGKPPMNLVNSEAFMGTDRNIKALTRCFLELEEDIQARLGTEPWNLKVGIRPAHTTILLGEHLPSEPGLILEGRVKSVEGMPPDYVVRVIVNGMKEDFAVETKILPDSSGWIQCFLPQEHLLFFSQITGRRIK